MSLLGYSLGFCVQHLCCIRFIGLIRKLCSQLWSSYCLNAGRLLLVEVKWLYHIFMKSSLTSKNAQSQLCIKRKLMVTASSSFCRKLYGLCLNSPPLWCAWRDLWSFRSGSLRKPSETHTYAHILQTCLCVNEAAEQMDEDTHPCVEHLIPEAAVKLLWICLWEDRKHQFSTE